MTAYCLELLAVALGMHFEQPSIYLKNAECRSEANFGRNFIFYEFPHISISIFLMMALVKLWACQGISLGIVGLVQAWGGHGLASGLIMPPINYLDLMSRAMVVPTPR